MTIHTESQTAQMGLPFPLGRNVEHDSRSRMFAFTPAAVDFTGQIRITGAVRGMPIYPGSEATVTGSGLQPGQTVTLLRGATVLNKEPITVDEKGFRVLQNATLAAILASKTCFYEARG